MEPLYAIAAVFLIIAAFRFGRRVAPTVPQQTPQQSPQEPQVEGSHLILSLASKVYYAVAQPADFLDDPNFMEGVRQMQTRPTASLVDPALGTNEIVACMALAALMRKEPDPSCVERLVGGIGLATHYEQYFVLRAIRVHAGNEWPSVGPVLLSIVRTRNPGWIEHPRS